MICFSRTVLMFLIGATSLCGALPDNDPSSPPKAVGKENVDKILSMEMPNKDNAERPKVPLPTDLKVFEMPGAVLIKNGQWQGVDYLGHISNQITVDVEIIKGDNTPEVQKDPLVSYARKLLNSVDIIRQLNQRERPPMPLLHLLLVVYPVDKDRLVIFGNCRLFEEVQVMRTDFISSGFWQAITWESLDVSTSSATELPTHLKDVVEKLVSGFIERYQLYNPDAAKIDANSTGK